MIKDRTSNTPGAWTTRARVAETSWGAAMWSETGQRIRFNKALEHLDLHAGHTLLDFGCGTGALSQHVPAGVDYLGVDWAPGMLMRARREHPHREFYFQLPEHTFTHACAIGVWNLCETPDDMFTTVDELWAITTHTLVVSVHRDIILPGQLAAHYADRGTWLRTLVDTSYLPNDSMLILRR